MNLAALNPKKILIVNIFGIGDVLFTTPLVSHLSKRFPEAVIDYIGNKRVAPMLEDYPRINKVFVYERDEFAEVSRNSKSELLRKSRKFIEEIKDERYDVLFDFSMNRMFNLFSSLAQIKTRIGFNYKNRSPYLTVKKNINGFENQHVIEFYLDLLKECGLETSAEPMEMMVNSANRQWAQDFLDGERVNDRQPIVGVFPGGGSSWGKSADLKRWPGSNYSKLIDKIVEKFNAQIILMGDQSEESLCSKISSECKNVVKAYGKTNLGQLSGLIRHCDLVVCNDGGPLHMAVALGTKTVSLFGPVDEHVYGPWIKSDRHYVATADVLCRPCYRRFRMTDCQHMSCLQTLQVDTVLEKVDKIL